MTVIKSSFFPASREEVYKRLQQLETLEKIARPFASFEPAGPVSGAWKEGDTYGFRLKLFGVIPMGIHRIHLVRFSPGTVSSREGNSFVPVWNHEIIMTPAGKDRTFYTDKVEIHAGWRTPFIWLWANAFLRSQAEKVDKNAERRQIDYGRGRRGWRT